MYNKELIIFMAIGSLLGCAISPANLEKPKIQSKIELIKNHIYLAEEKECNIRVLFSLPAGIYISEYQNDSGTFYRGPKNALNYELRSTCAPLDVIYKSEGGIFVPFDSKSIFRIYQYLGSESRIERSNLEKETENKELIALGPSGMIISKSIESGLHAYEKGKISFTYKSYSEGIESKIKSQPLNQNPKPD